MADDLLDHLRTAAQASHRRLEDDLDLLTPPFSEVRFRILLQRFYGFHAAWEPSLGRWAELAGLAAGRSRLPHLGADLRALGLPASAIDALPLCPGAERLAYTLAGALGSLYVMEGSTLGGKVIRRALQGTAWLPAGGLGYFDPYGAESGAMWRKFRQDLNAFGVHDQAAVSDGAIATFDLLRRWLTA